MRLDIGVIKMSNIYTGGGSNSKWVLKKTTLASVEMFTLAVRKNGYAPLIVSFNIQPSEKVCKFIHDDYVDDLEVFDEEINSMYSDTSLG